MRNSHNTNHNTKNVVLLAVCQALFNSGPHADLYRRRAGRDLDAGRRSDIGHSTDHHDAGRHRPWNPAVGFICMRVLGRKSGFVIGAAVGAAGGAVSAIAIGIESFLLFNAGIFLFGLYGGAAQQYRFAAADVAPEHIKAKSVSIVIAMGIVGAFVGPETTLMTKHLFGWAPF